MCRDETGSCDNNWYTRYETYTEIKKLKKNLFGVKNVGNDHENRIRDMESALTELNSLTIDDADEPDTGFEEEVQAGVYGKDAKKAAEAFGVKPEAGAEFARMFRHLPNIDNLSSVKTPPYKPAKQEPNEELAATELDYTMKFLNRKQ